VFRLHLLLNARLQRSSLHDRPLYPQHPLNPEAKDESRILKELVLLFAQGVDRNFSALRYHEHRFSSLK
jgi:hypothetical protein